LWPLSPFLLIRSLEKTEIERRERERERKEGKGRIPFDLNIEDLGKDLLFVLLVIDHLLDILRR